MAGSTEEAMDGEIKCVYPAVKWERNMSGAAADMSSTARKNFPPKFTSYESYRSGPWLSFKRIVMENMKEREVML